MQTIYDWLTVGIFAGLILLFLQRSNADEPRDKLYQYFPAAIGCAIANYLGNNHYDIAAIVMITTTLMYIWYVLKPMNFWKE